MRTPETLLLDIVAAAKRLAAYIDGMTRDQFLEDNKTKAACVREIEIIGEAAKRMPTEYKSLHPEIPWSDLTRLRNLYIHVYERIRYDRVWLTVTRTVPGIAAKAAEFVPEEPRGTPEDSTPSGPRAAKDESGN